MRDLASADSVRAGRRVAARAARLRPREPHQRNQQQRTTGHTRSAAGTNCRDDAEQHGGRDVHGNPQRVHCRQCQQYQVIAVTGNGNAMFAEQLIQIGNDPVVMSSV